MLTVSPVSSSVKNEWISRPNGRLFSPTSPAAEPTLSTPDKGMALSSIIVTTTAVRDSQVAYMYPTRLIQSAANGQDKRSVSLNVDSGTSREGSGSTTPTNIAQVLSQSPPQA